HWEKFRQQSKAWDQGKGVRRNNANLDQKLGPQGIEIVVTGDSLLLGDVFYSFENASINALAERIEFHDTNYKRSWPSLAHRPAHPARSGRSTSRGADRAGLQPGQSRRGGKPDEQSPFSPAFSWRSRRNHRPGHAGDRSARCR